MNVKVFDLVGDSCLTQDDGKIIYDKIYPELLSRSPVELDFNKVSVFASPCFNNAIGRLLRDIPADTLNELLVISHISPVGSDVLKRVIENSKLYYLDPAHKEAQDSILLDQSKGE